MVIIKRDGTRQEFNKDKIVKAVLSAFLDVDKDVSEYAKMKADNIATHIEEIAKTKELNVEEIQTYVQRGLMSTKRKDVAEKYIEYRLWRTWNRGNTTDREIEEITNNTNDYWAKENSNKNPVIVTTQRDYIAGAVNTDISRRKLLTKKIVKSHDNGEIHFHDMDYFYQKALTNCELVNLEDMLQNGTVVNDVLIEKPHRLIKATTIATQIILAVTSSTYGGCTVTLTHLAPFVRDSYNRFIKKYRDFGLDEDTAKKLADIDIKKEVEDSVQTFNYQVNSMTNTNGQAPFLSVCMYIGETDEYKEELAMLIEEFLKQRIQGFKNEQGVWITPAFPKLLFVLEEDNMHPTSKYYYLKELAIKCSAKRLTPDYISEKMMKQLKIDANGNGQCYPCIKFCA